MYYCMCVYRVQQQYVYTCMHVCVVVCMYTCVCVSSLPLSVCTCVYRVWVLLILLCVYYVLLYSSSVCTTILRVYVCVSLYYVYTGVCVCSTLYVCVCVWIHYCVYVYSMYSTQCMRIVCVCMYSTQCMYVLLCTCVASPCSLRACVLPGACSLAQGRVSGCVYASTVSVYNVSHVRGLASSRQWLPHSVQMRSGSAVRQIGSCGIGCLVVARESGV